MVYRSRFRGRSRMRRRRVYRRRFRRYSSRRRFGGRRGYRQSRSLLSPERKFYNYANSLFVLQASNVGVAPLISPGQGVGATLRIGEKIKVTRLHVQVRIGTADWTASTATPTKVYFILDRQANGALPAYADIFDTLSPNAPDMVFFNLAGRRRFRVVKALKFGYSEACTWNGIGLLGQVQGSAAVGRTLLRSFRKKMRLGMVFTDTNAGGSISQIITNSIVPVFLLGPAMTITNGVPPLQEIYNLVTNRANICAQIVSRARFVDP